MTGRGRARLRGSGIANGKRRRSSSAVSPSEKRSDRKRIPNTKYKDSSTTSEAPSLVRSRSRGSGASGVVAGPSTQFKHSEDQVQEDLQESFLCTTHSETAQLAHYQEIMQPSTQEIVDAVVKQRQQKPGVATTVHTRTVIVS